MSIGLTVRRFVAFIPLVLWACSSGSPGPGSGGGGTVQCKSASDCPQPGGACSEVTCPNGTCELIDICTTDGGSNPCAGRPCGSSCRTGLRVNAEACTADGQCDEANFATCTCTSCTKCTVSGCAP